MIYEHPLAYLLGIEGVALLRGFVGEYDREFVEARIAEVRRLLADETLAGAAVAVERVGTVEGYRIWSATYDDGRNTAFDFDEPIVEEIVDAVPAGVAVDAACGTGRFSALLAARGHRVIGVDSSPEMLARARANVAGADFRSGELAALPVADTSADLVTCGLALSHVPNLRPAFTEFARVLRPGGHLVISDMHPERILRGANPTLRDPDGRPGRLPGHRHLVGDYLRAALAAGLELRRCEEPVTEPSPLGPPATELGPWEVWPWSLAAVVPEAARAADAGVPVEIIWHFQLAQRP
ncbi:methyltransferase family protein [Pseudonocardia hierapolitana]|uniref:Methyltransferase family protein n=1 Tax=Pseudonocardia hierapolitana TaxID=1128676 RepID=A0A561SV71_9PSEU|nr:class I SAM-dependent methyltransferase [Pseudonocardia hierapolitana]TWF78746.1 methyltransferase family protein [Pseudonocardia hierapolitana]